MDTDKMLQEAQELNQRHSRSPMIPVRQGMARMLEIIGQMAGHIKTQDDHIDILASERDRYMENLAALLETEPDSVAPAGVALHEQLHDTLLPQMTKAHRDRRKKREAEILSNG